MISKATGFFIAFFLLFFDVPVQSQVFTYQVLNEESGLPQNFIYTINQDTNGFIWIGTGKGLTRYDGRQTQTFLQQQGLAENFITASFVAASGHILYGHYNGSTSIFNGIYHSPLISDTLKSEIVALGEDYKHVIWCASRSNGLLKILPDLTTHTLIFPGELQGKIIQDMLILGSQMVIGTSEGLYTFIISDSGLIFKDTPSVIQFEEIISLAKSHDDSLHVWAGSSDNTLYRIKIGAATSIESKQRVDIKTFSAILSVIEDKKNDLWIGTLEGGLVHLTLNNKKRISGIKIFNQESGYPLQSVKEVFVDSNEDVWAGTFSEGLVKIFKQPFQFISLQANGINQINDIQIRSGIYYLATNKGLYSYNNRSSSKDKLNLVPLFRDQALLSVAATSDSTLWVGTALHGLVRYHQKTDRKEYINLPTPNGELVKARLVKFDKKGNCWVSAIGNGVYKISNQGQVLKHLTTQDGFIHNDIFAIYPEANGTVWFGSLGAGLACLDANDSLHLLSQQGIFPSHDVNDITGDEKGHVWIATDGQGYFQFDGSKFINPGGSSAGSIPFIKGIGYDSNKGLWLTHRKGITYVDLKTFEKRDFTSKDGIDKNRSYASKTLLDENTVLINNENGFTLADRHENSRKITLAPILTDVKLFFDKPIKIRPSANEIKKQLFPYLELEHDENHVTFNFTAIAHGYHGDIYYRYFIKEIEPEWSPITTEDHVTYAALNPGKYTLKIQATIDPTRWSNRPLEYSFRIRKPFWKQWWFYIIQTLGICLIFGLTYYLSRTKTGKSSVVKIMVFMSLFIIYEFVQNWAEMLLPSLQGSAPILKTLINLVFAFAFYPIESLFRKFLHRETLK